VTEASTAAASSAALRPSKLLFKPEVLDRVGRTFPTLWRMMREGKFPRARDVGGQPAWLESEIEDWITALPVRPYKGDTALPTTQTTRRRVVNLRKARV